MAATRVGVAAVSSSAPPSSRPRCSLPPLRCLAAPPRPAKAVRAVAAAAAVAEEATVSSPSSASTRDLLRYIGGRRVLVGHSSGRRIPMLSIRILCGHVEVYLENLAQLQPEFRPLIIHALRLKMINVLTAKGFDTSLGWDHHFPAQRVNDLK